MKFYDRTEELEILKKNWEQSSRHDTTISPLSPYPIVGISCSVV